MLPGKDGNRGPRHRAEPRTLGARGGGGGLRAGLRREHKAWARPATAEPPAGNVKGAPTPAEPVGRTAAPAPAPPRAERPVPELHETAASGGKTAARAGRLPAALAESAGARVPLPGSRAVSPLGPRHAPRGAPGSLRGRGTEVGVSGLGGPRGHFRPSAAWPRAGSAHAQRPMELPESGPGPRCRGEPAAEAALARLSTQACESGYTKTSKEGPVPRMCPLTER